MRQIAANFPLSIQQELRRLRFSRQIRRGVFESAEAEYKKLAEFVSPGDWVLDIGANVGHYTARLSEIVGPAGRVIAFEPVPETFELLAANVLKLPCRNVSLLNVAVSDEARIAGVGIPKANTGLRNYYRASLSGNTENLCVFCLSIDSLKIPTPVALAKLDVEGHELSALKGMEELIERDKPILIVEGHGQTVAGYLGEFGYTFESELESANRVYMCR